MTENTRQIWIEKGYEHFALLGPERLTINQLSKSTGIARASFYHHFGDMEVFLEEVLARHWQVALDFNAAGKSRCKRLIPDLYNLLGEHPIPLLFSRQLFLHRSSPDFNYLFIKTYETSAKDFALPLFAKHLGLNHSEPYVYRLWFTLGEAWYSRLDPADLQPGTLQWHAEEILKSLSDFLNSELFKRIN